MMLVHIHIHASLPGLNNAPAIEGTRPDPLPLAAVVAPNEGEDFRFGFKWDVNLFLVYITVIVPLACLAEPSNNTGSST
jgi:hypothetical protein